MMYIENATSISYRKFRTIIDDSLEWRRSSIGYENEMIQKNAAG